MRWVLFALGLLAVTSTVYAQPAPAPTYMVGDTWTVKTGKDAREVKVLKVNDGGSADLLGLFAVCPTCIYQVDPNLTILAVLDASGKPVDVTQVGFVPLGSQWRFFDFPLELKKKWNISATGFLRGRSEAYEVSNLVEALEDVKTPAGTFKAYRIVRDWVLKASAQIRQRDVTWRTTSWYAPDVKFTVKTTTTNPNQENSELMAYSLKK